MAQIYANNFTTLSLGRQGENLARQIIFDVQDWESLYGPGTVEVIYQRPGDELPYPVAVQREGTLVTWTITATDTEMAGSHGKCELRYYVGETLAKSKIWRTWVEPSLSTPSETAPPEPEQGWVERVLEAGVSAKEAAERAEKAAIHQPYPNAETETWWVWDPGSGEYLDSGLPFAQSNGKKLVTVTLTAEGWSITEKTQTVPATGVLSDEPAQLIQIIPASASMAAYRAAGVLCVSQGADSLTFAADSLPYTDLTVYAVIEELKT